MDTIFMNSKINKTSDYGLLPNLSDKTDLKGNYVYVALSNLRTYCT